MKLLYIQPNTLTLYSNEPKNTETLKTVPPLITQFNAVMRRILICFLSLMIVLIYMSFCFFFCHPPSSRKHKHKHSGIILQLIWWTHQSTNSVWTAGFVYSKITWNWGNEVTMFPPAGGTGVWWGVFISSSLCSLCCSSSYLGFFFPFIRSHFSRCWNNSNTLILL